MPYKDTNHRHVIAMKMDDNQPDILKQIYSFYCLFSFYLLIYMVRKPPSKIEQ